MDHETDIFNDDGSARVHSNGYASARVRPLHGDGAHRGHDGDDRDVKERGRHDSPRNGSIAGSLRGRRQHSTHSHPLRFAL